MYINIAGGMLFLYYCVTDLHNKWLISKAKSKPTKEATPVPDGLLSKFKVQDVDHLVGAKPEGYDCPATLREELLTLQVCVHGTVSWWLTMFALVSNSGDLEPNPHPHSRRHHHHHLLLHMPL